VKVHTIATFPCQDGGVSFLIAHRGHSAKAPENTLVAFRAAEEAGFSWVETDADLLADGTVVLIHDPTFKRTAHARDRVSHVVASDLDSLDAGSWFSEEFFNVRVPRLDALVDLMIETGLNANIELKLTDPTPDRVETYISAIGQSLQRLPAEGRSGRVIISSFNHQLLAAFHIQLPEFPTACLFERGRFAPFNRHSVWRDAARFTGASFVHPHHRELTADIVRKIYEEGLRVNTWTVNSAERAAQLASWGVEGICTDGPESLTPETAPENIGRPKNFPVKQLSA